MRLSAVVSAVAGVGLLGLATAASAQEAAVKGKVAYEAAMPKCKTCHSIGGVGNAKGPLEGIGTKLKPEEIKAWIRTPKEMTEKAKATRKPAMPAYGPDKINDATLEALTAYLSSLK
jgi:mono/diheme cytochrome c family protein